MVRASLRLALAVGAIAVGAGAFVLLLRRAPTASSSDSPSPELRLLLVGWDGADWDVLEPLIERGELPRLAALRGKGSWGRLRSVEPILSPVVWTSIATGVLPEKHGVTWFMVDTEHRGRRVPVTSGMRQRKAFWNILHDLEVPVGVIGWWATYPAEPVRGFVVSDFVGYHGFGLTGREVRVEIGKVHPPDVLAEAEEAFSVARSSSSEDLARFLGPPGEKDPPLAEGTSEPDPSANRPRALFRDALATARAYTSMAGSLSARFRPALLAVYFEISDSASHLFSRFREPKLPRVSEEGHLRYRGVVDTVYRELDLRLGELLDLCGPDTSVILVSDHGFADGAARPDEGDEVQIANAHNWHEHEGILLAAGPPFRPGHRVARASVLDVLPTMLRALELPVASDLDGHVLVDAFRPEWLSRHAPERVDSFETERPSAEKAPVEAAEAAFAREVEERLSALGYLGRDEAGSAEIHVGRARLHLEKRNWREAEDEIQKALRLQPANAGIRMELAAIYLRTGRERLAEEELDRILRIDPRHYLALCTLAGLLKERGKLEEARVLFETAASILADHPAAHLGLGDVHHRLGFDEAAESEFRRCLELDLTNATAHYNLGVLLSARGALAEARAEYETALSFDPAHLATIMNLADLHAREGRQQDALSLLERGLEIEPDRPELLYNLGSLLLEVGMPDRAVGHLERAVAARPDFVSARVNLALAHLRAGHPAKAAEQLEVSTRLEPGDAQSWYLLASIEASLGRSERAKASLERAIRIGSAELRAAAEQDEVLRPLLPAVVGSPSGERER